VRVNRGGSDLHGLAVASRLTSREYLAYVKRARNDPDDPKRLTPPQESKVRPGSRPGFPGKVVLLTGRHTISAGETFVMALLGRAPHVVRVGENTQGMFSDILRRDLPNGFSFGLPNEVYFAEDGKMFEADGIPPDVQVPIFPEGDLKDGKDQAIEKAMEILTPRK
jgi:C-terminal processing protease CtpA/Prc